MTEFELFKRMVEERLGLSDSDVGRTHDGNPWVSLEDGETYTFFTFSYDDERFTGCLSRRYSDHEEIEPPFPMSRLRDDFQELKGMQ